MTILKPSHPEIDSILELFTQGRLNIVLKKISQLNNDFPDQALLSNISGACHVGLGQLNDAIKCYEDAIAIAPDYAKAHYNLGGVLHEMDNLDDAIQSYQKSLIIDPDYAEAHNNLGNIFREIGQFDDAMQCFKNAVKKKVIA